MAGKNKDNETKTGNNETEEFVEGSRADYSKRLQNILGKKAAKSTRTQHWETLSVRKMIKSLGHDIGEDTLRAIQPDLDLMFSLGMTTDMAGEMLAHQFKMRADLKQHYINLANKLRSGPHIIKGQPQAHPQQPVSQYAEEFDEDLGPRRPM